ncbi:MAG: hypothetical protein FJ126_00995 [Deltaproteobacteria bacterium]|nr:hypothetical protein [Deltaproteobacteria bacterium]
MLLFLALVPAGCSVAMALSGSTPPDPAVISLGSTRGEAEAYWGEPSSVKTEGGRTLLYHGP